MIRLRLLVLLAGAGALVGAVPVSAAPDPELRARSLLLDAARAAATRSFSGTQYVGTWRGRAQTSAVVDVVHRPGTGSTVRDGASRAVALTPELDERLLSLLAAHYDLVVAGEAHCAGRATHVVEARRDGVVGAGRVAGRFWLDTATGLVLRREVYDTDGTRLRSSAFVDVRIAPGSAAEARPGTVRADPAAVLPRTGWQPPRQLPGGLELFEARVRQAVRGTVLHLAYSDGLSTLSLFAQRGSLGAGPPSGFRVERLQGTRAYVQQAAPERVVWQGGGRVFTVVTDAAPATVRAAVGVLPRDPAPGRGLLARLARGAARVGHWLDPFD